jgi:hypothetical protein
VSIWHWLIKHLVWKKSEFLVVDMAMFAEKITINHPRAGEFEHFFSVSIVFVACLLVV